MPQARAHKVEQTNKLSNKKVVVLGILKKSQKSSKYIYYLYFNL